MFVKCFKDQTTIPEVCASNKSFDSQRPSSSSVKMLPAEFPPAHDSLGTINDNHDHQYRQNKLAESIQWREVYAHNGNTPSKLRSNSGSKVIKAAPTTAPVKEPIPPITDISTTGKSG
jgi:hypothetical protein